MLKKEYKWFMLIILSLIWGSSFILIKRGLIGLNPIQLGSLRVIFATLFLIIIGYQSIVEIPQTKWKFIALTAFIGTFIPAFLFAIAQTQINSSISSILNSLTPMNTLLIGASFFGLAFKRQQLLGVFVGLVGSVLLIYNGSINHPNQNYNYTILILISTICYAINVNLIKKYLSDLTPLSIIVGNFIVLFFPSLLILFCTDFTSKISFNTTQISLIYVCILGVVGSGIANYIFFHLIQVSSPIFATSVTYLIPIVAFGWGLLDNESLTATQLLGALIILLGVYLASKK